MADIALEQRVTDEKQITVVKRPGHNDQHTAPAAEAISAGSPIRLDTATGRWTNANGTSAAEARVTHIAVRTVVAGESLTGVRGCLIGGLVLDALAYDAPVYLSNTDGRLADAAGTTSVIIGRVVPAFAMTLGNAPDKLLDVAALR